MMAQREIRLYEGKAPGSENWDWEEAPLIGFADTTVIYNVATPTITEFLPEKPNGIALVICPGGGWYSLWCGGEGVWLAKELNKHGITCLMLKYRLGHDDEQNTICKKILSRGGSQVADSVCPPYIPLMVQDAHTAIKYVRDHSKEYGIDPNRIGIEGSSAGGTVAMSAALSVSDPACKPNFVGITYGYQPLVIGDKVPENTPLFLAAATDDRGVPTACSIKFYQQWVEAGEPAEMHLYQKGGHGFVREQKTGYTTDDWLDAFVKWIFMNNPV